VCVCTHTHTQLFRDLRAVVARAVVALLRVCVCTHTHTQLFRDLRAVVARAVVALLRRICMYICLAELELS
jgi:hypothetical protein